MKSSVYIFSAGKLAKKDNSLVFSNEEGKKHIPIEGIKEIFIFGELNINKRLLEFLTKKQIIMIFYNHYGYYTGTYYPREHYNAGYMILKQAETYLNNQERLYLAKQFVTGACKNCLKILNYYFRREKKLEAIIKTIKDYLEKIEEQNAIEKIMAFEGQTKKEYYKSFNIIIKNEDFHFSSRSRRPPRDNINALISFGNSLIYNYSLAEIYKTHLDPRIGFLHSSNFRSFSLNLDIAEVFKPVIADRSIFHLVNKNIITVKDFEKNTGGVFLNEKGRKKFIEKIEERLKQTIKHAKLDKNVSYRRLMRMELYKIEKHLIGEKKYSPFVMDW